MAPHFTNRHTILIVDDDPEIVELLKDHFKKRGCEVIATLDSLTVVETLSLFSVKLMLLDLKMRILDGFDVLDKIKKAGMPLPPTVVITGFLPRYEEKLKRYGIVREDVLTKPFNFDDLEIFINRKLGRQIVPGEVGSEYEDKIYQSNRCRIGVVEDETDVLRYLAEFFTERRYTVSCFRTAQESIDYLETERLDILIVDIKMPGLSGDQLIERLTTLPDHPFMIPISAAFTPKEMLDRFKELGCGRFFSKPFDVTELIEYVKTVSM